MSEILVTAVCAPVVKRQRRSNVAPIMSAPRTRTSCRPGGIGDCGVYVNPCAETYAASVTSRPSNSTWTLFGSI
jgi:hypothetical protein